jgi:hypothetical protein
VHASLVALVTDYAGRHSAWADYAAVLLDPETAAFFAARLPPPPPTAAAAAARTTPSGTQSPPSASVLPQKRKANSGEAIEPWASSGSVCDHCGGRGGATTELLLRMACLDGAVRPLTVPRSALVSEVKKAIGEVRAGTRPRARPQPRVGNSEES